MKYLFLVLFLTACSEQYPIANIEKNKFIYQFKPNQMLKGCVYQESNGQIIKTCG